MQINIKVYIIAEMTNLQKLISKYFDNLLVAQVNFQHKNAK